MRTFTALIFCLYVLAPTFSLARGDKEEPCDANPRWLLVTVLEAEHYKKKKGEKTLSKVDLFSKKTPEGVTFPP